MKRINIKADLYSVPTTILLLAIVGVGIGVVVSLLAIAFYEAFLWLNKEFLIDPHERIQLANNPLLLSLATVGVPAVGGLLVGFIIYYFVSARRPLGPPDTILLVQTRGTPQPFGSSVASTFAAVLSLGCGASVGHYGPLVYLGTLIGSLVSSLRLKVPNLQAICIASGVAAAISVAFNAPIAGMVFAHEVILRHFSVKAFAPTTVAAAIGFIIANVIFDRPPLFLVVFEGVQYSYEFVLFAVIGILGALLAVGYAKGILLCQSYASRSGIPEVFRPMVAGLILGVVALQFPEVLGVGRESLRFATIGGAFELGELTILIIAKIFVTILCLGFGFAGGVFGPILLIGILCGALFGGILDQLQIFGHSGVVPYAICGMMAAATPVIGAPLAMILIVFELTRNYDLTTAAMVAVVFSNLLASRMFGRSLFDVQLAFRGFDLSLGRVNALISYGSVTEIMRTEYPIFSTRDKIGKVAYQLAHIGRTAGVVVDANERPVGVVHVRDCTGRPPTTLLKDVMNPETMRFSQDTNVGQALEAFRQSDYEVAPIVSAKTQKLLGIVYESDVISKYREIADRIRQEEHDPI